MKKKLLTLLLALLAALSVCLQRSSARSRLCSTVTSYLSARKPGRTAVEKDFSSA